ncbi:MAG TPA: hypothetical protein VEO96_09300 [Thermoplasmata archaeon]|nr:hypothetical protein [Thermoplasmata archaeon]
MNVVIIPILIVLFFRETMTARNLLGIVIGLLDVAAVAFSRPPVEGPSRRTGSENSSR